jgi:hypothetical protein
MMRKNKIGVEYDIIDSTTINEIIILGSREEKIHGSDGYGYSALNPVVVYSLDILGSSTFAFGPASGEGKLKLMMLFNLSLRELSSENSSTAFLPT